MHSLRVKITGITIAAILASLMAFGLIAFLTVGQEITISSTERMNLLAQNAQQSLDIDLRGIEQSVTMAAHIATDSLDSIVLVESGAHEPIDARTKQQTETLDAYMSAYCAQVQKAFGSVASHTGNISTYYYCINPDISSKEHGFFYSKMGKVGFEEEEPLDARTLDPNDLGHTTWYYTPIEHGMPTWVGPYTAHFLDDVLTVSYLTPIYKSGILIGVLGMDILFDTMVNHIGSLDVYDTGFACLLDDQGRVLYHPEHARGETPEFASYVVDNTAKAQASVDEESIRYTKRGSSWQLSYATLCNGMKLVVTAPVSEVTAAWRHLLYIIPLVAAAILALFVPLTLLGMKAITQPLHQLTEAAHQLSQGKYDIELDYQKDDEVGELTNAFRHLRDHLKVYISNLNSQAYVDSLTQVKNKGAYDIYTARLNDTIASSEEHMPEFALVMFDCNGLKTINDSYGHDKGDVYLQSACKTICQVFSHSPVFRVGGDEFVVLLQNRDYANRFELLRDFEIRASMANRRVEEPWQKVDIAKGMSTFRPTEDKGVEEVLHRADQRMYEDKHGKRD